MKDSNENYVKLEFSSWTFNYFSRVFKRKYKEFYSFSEFISKSFFPQDAKIIWGVQIK